MLSLPVPKTGHVRDWHYCEPDFLFIKNSILKTNRKKVFRYICYTCVSRQLGQELILNKVSMVEIGRCKGAHKKPNSPTEGYHA